MLQFMRWISEQVKARWMLHALDQGEIEGVMDHREILAEIHQGASERSGTKRWISEQ